MTSFFRHPYVLHLRLAFNLLLSPVYLWGVFLAGGSIVDAGFWLGYLSLHLFLYGGTTAFNSFYDRDDGPVGGMLAPPPVDQGLLRFSLLVQALGLVPAALVGRWFLLSWLVLFIVFTAYSHPAVRLKARVAASLAAIALGQGALGFALGWLAAVGPAGITSGRSLAGMLVAALVVAGLYLVTQSYQTQADSERGDVTVAVLLGPRRSLAAALLPLGLGGLLFLALLRERLDWIQLASLAAFFAALSLWLLLWAARFDPERVQENFRVAMRFTITASVGLSLFLLLRLVS